MKVLKVLAWVVGTPLVLFGLLLLARFVSCGPNSADVKVMKPMAEKISAYIVKNGIPKNLKDIPDLPYELVECIKKETYEKNGKEVLIAEEENKIINWSCFYVNQKMKYDLNIRYTGWFKRVSIKIFNNKHNTGLGARLKKNHTNLFEIEYIGSGYVLSHTGICTQFKQ